MKIKQYGAKMEELKRAGKTNREIAEAVTLSRVMRKRKIRQLIEINHRGTKAPIGCQRAGWGQ